MARLWTPPSLQLPPVPRLARGWTQGAGTGAGIGALEEDDLVGLIASLGGLAILPSPAILSAGGILVPKTGIVRATEIDQTDLDMEAAGHTAYSADAGVTKSKETDSPYQGTRYLRITTTGGGGAYKTAITGCRYAISGALRTQGGLLGRLGGGGSGAAFTNPSGTLSTSAADWTWLSGEGTTVSPGLRVINATAAGVVDCDAVSLSNISIRSLYPTVAAGVWADQLLEQVTATAMQWDGYTGTIESPGIRTIRSALNDYSAITPSAAIADWSTYLCLNVNAIALTQYVLGVNGTTAGIRTGDVTGALEFFDGTNYLEGSAIPALTTAIFSVSKLGTTYNLRVNNGAVTTNTLADVPLSKLTLGAQGAGTLTAPGHYPGLIAVPYQAMGGGTDQTILRQFAAKCGVAL